MRYAGQSMEVRVPAPAGAINDNFLAALIDAFHAAHLRTFGYNYAGQQKVELVNFCVSGFGLIERPALPELAEAGGVPRPKATRPVYFAGTFRDTPVYDRARLPPRHRLTGPRWSRSSARPPWCFRINMLMLIRMEFSIVRRARSLSP